MGYTATPRLLRGMWGAATPGLVGLCCLFLHFYAADSLKVARAGPLKVLVNEAAAIPCRFYTDYKAAQDLKNVGIRWFRRLNNEEQEIYTFDGEKGVHNRKKAGSNMLEKEIKLGNATLHLPRVQFEDEGDYKCVVFVTPSKAEGTVSLEVSAQPKACLSDTQIELEHGTEKSLACLIYGLYPPSITIHWKAFLKNTEKADVISKDICTAPPEKNPDGTFNVTSNLRLHPSLDDNHNVYMCFVEHRSLPSPLQLNATLKIKEKDTFLTTIIGAVFGTLSFCLLLLVTCYCIYTKFFKQVAPKITEITGNEVLVHMEEAKLSFQITGFSPQDIKFVLSLERPGTKKLIHSFCSKPQAEEKDEEANIPLRNGQCRESMDSIRCVTHVEGNTDGTFSVPCDITILPDLQEHNGAKLCLSVTHKALSGPMSIERSLHVRGVPPKVSDIVVPLKVLHLESLTLTCPINGFKPRPLIITWVKRDTSDHEEKLLEYNLDSDEPEYLTDKYFHTTSVNKFDDETSSILSVLIFAPTINTDNGIRFLCRIHHLATAEQIEKMCTLLVTAPPVLDAIQALPEVPCTEDILTLSCRIHSFFPKPIEVYWFKDSELMSAMSSTTDVTSGPDGLCSCTSTIKFTPRREDHGKKFICRVGHKSLENHKGVMNYKEIKWEFQHLICRPKGLEIVCDPVVPAQGVPVTLSCIVKDYFPKECKVKWFKEFQPIQADVLESPVLCEETDLYRRETHITFIPTKDDHNKDFSVEVFHCRRQIRGLYHMILKDMPVLKDITLEPKEVVYGQPVTLSCQVMGCDPSDVTVSWFEKDTQIVKGLRTHGSPPSSNDAVTSTYYLLEITPSALHFNRELVCKVKHKNLQQTFTKQIYLPLKPQPPVASDIILTTMEIKSKKMVCLSINVSHFAPQELQVKWYKAWNEFSKEMCTCSVPEIGDDGLYFITSKAEFCPSPSDNGTQIRCEVTHRTTKAVIEKKILLNLKGSRTPPPVAPRKNPKNETDIEREVKSSEIECLTRNPRAGENVTLTYFVNGYNADDASISWTGGKFPVDGDYIQNEITEDGAGCVSTVTFQTEPHHKECEVKCEVTINGETTEKTYLLKLT
ncbi:natural cytotoxicity triggering receptor 3 ligand 1 [Ambystoma mexicanum]|uniref:natural cytotoxicity triggering receptor 3 ligand 1 n=1 Tax=Ambystoma mexicanum TaxID=8296 RepID=UPI0037E7AB06